MTVCDLKYIITLSHYAIASKCKCSDVDRSEKSDFGPNSDQFLEWSENGPKNGLKSDFLTSLDF